MNRDDMLIGAVLIAIGIIVGGTGQFTQLQSSFTDSYPGGEQWSDIGTHNNTFQDTDDSLLIDNTSEQGVFTSDIIVSTTKFNVDSIIYEASDIKPNQNQEIYLTISSVDETNAIIDTVNITIDENGRYSVPVGDLGNGDSNYEGYQFEAVLTTDSSTSPKLDELEIKGENIQGSSQMNTAIMWLFMFLGMMMLIRGLN